nr:MAG TPA: tail-collar fiber protein [Caudoviricetes sp.]
MAEWSNATMTDVGAALQAKVNAGKTKLTFTKIKVGSGVNATNPLALTDVISSKWETTNFVVKLEGKIVSVDTVITNAGIHEAFRMSEIGLFAQDPDKGEILYAYLTDPEPDRMPAESGSVVVSQELTIGMVFSNTGNVSLTVNIGALITREQLTEAVKQHNTDISSHPPITDQIKAILGSSNWKDSPASTLVTIKSLLGQGAIVASKLDANAGFVKFANGFTIQWGAGGQDNVIKTEVTFPIRFTRLFMANAIDAYWSGSDTPRYFANSVSESNNTKAVFVASDKYAASYYWFALGII